MKRKREKDKKALWPSAHEVTGKTMSKPYGQGAKQIDQSNDAGSRSTGINRWMHICTLAHWIIIQGPVILPHYHITGVDSGIGLLHVLHGAKNQYIIYMLITEPYLTLSLRPSVCSPQSTVQSPDQTSAIRSRSPPVYFITSHSSQFSSLIGTWSILHHDGIL